jgi:hypothetical protein
MSINFKVEQRFREMGWIITGKGGRTEQEWGLERFQRRSKDIKGRRSIFAEGKFNELGRLLPGPHEEEKWKRLRDRDGFG